MHNKWLAFVVALLLGTLSACGQQQGAGTVTERAVAEVLRDAKVSAQEKARVAMAVEPDKQILFGDLHVHTTFSPDAFITGLPLMGGQGAKPPADACDFARHCSSLDFWGISDHAEGITPRRWQETKESVRQCNAVAGSSENPDMVTYLGWEWSQVALTAEKHYGHKNVFFEDTAEDQVPKRSIAAPRKLLGVVPMGKAAQLALAFKDWDNRQYYFDVDKYYSEISETAVCEKGVPSTELPDSCLETAATPEELFTKLDDWGFEALVIPHGNTWGLATPPETSWDKQLTNSQQNPNYQKLIEVYSGHGSADEYEEIAPFLRDEQGEKYCPEPKPGYTACCWRAGEIIEQRCEDPLSERCQANIVEARENYLNAGISGHLTVPGARVEDWLNCGQCEDCFNPAFKARPKTSTQYALALNKPENDKEKQRFRFGFIGSSDNHRAAAGSGYKEFGRRKGMTEVNGPLDKGIAAYSNKNLGEPVAKSRSREEVGEVGLNQLRNMERQASFFMTGGLVAVHSAGRSRGKIWDALNERAVYATSGDRTLLWFDLINGPNGDHAMGSEVEMSGNPSFRVSAAGAFYQLPGCPEDTQSALGDQRIESLCRGECYNPSDKRKAIDRIEVVKIRPRSHDGETTRELIEDPWRVFPCEASDGTCSVEFEDPEFNAESRDAIYYVRAIQKPSLGVNAGGLRCEYDDNGQCVKVNPCFGDYRTDYNDECLSPNEERAWSSPIFVDYQL